jgi:pilus assembly protein CpaE
LDVADRILLVAVPDLAALHDAKRFIEMSRSLDYQPGKLLVALNRAGIKGSVKSSDVTASLSQDLFIEIPDDDARVLRSLNRGVPLLIRYPRSPTSKAIQGLAKKLQQQEVLDGAAEAAGLPSPI